MIESNEVIDVGVRNENIGDLQQVGGRLRRKVTEVHQERATLPSKPHVEARVPEDPVEQPGLKEIGHLPSSMPSPLKGKGFALRARPEGSG